MYKKSWEPAYDVPSRVKWSQKNPQATDWERCLGKIELDSLGKENEGKSNNSGTQ